MLIYVSVNCCEEALMLVIISVWLACPKLFLVRFYFWGAIDKQKEPFFILASNSDSTNRKNTSYKTC